MRNELTRERLRSLMREIARGAPARGGPYHVYLVGGGTAVWAGWREASIDVDLFSEHDELFDDVQGMKERLNINIEFVRPEHFVPPLPGAQERHVFVETIEPVHFYHYDPYSQLFSKVVRGFTLSSKPSSPNSSWPVAKNPSKPSQTQLTSRTTEEQ